jgi:hypothetical protein
MNMEKVKLHTRMYGWKHVWMEFAEEFQGSVEDSNPDSSQTGMSIMLPVQNTNWGLIYTLVPGENGNHSHTTVETNYHANSDFKFAIHPQKQLGALSKLFGMQDIIIGDKDFDPRFVIKANDSSRVRELFADGQLRALILEEPTIEISAHPDSTDSKPSPRLLAVQQHVLSLKIPGIVDDFERLKGLHSLMKLLLTNLCVEDAATVPYTEGTTAQAPSFS